MITQASIYGQHVDLARSGVFTVVASGVPTDGVTGVGICDKGSEYVDIATGNRYFQKGTLSSPSWKLVTTA
jgi:hypothetical protein